MVPRPFRVFDYSLGYIHSPYPTHTRLSQGNLLWVTPRFWQEVSNPESYGYRETFETRSYLFSMC